jgi:hypothetical protein
MTSDWMLFIAKCRVFFQHPNGPTFGFGSPVEFFIARFMLLVARECLKVSLHLSHRLCWLQASDCFPASEFPFWLQAAFQFFDVFGVYAYPQAAASSFHTYAGHV